MIILKVYLVELDIVEMQNVVQMKIIIHVHKIVPLLALLVEAQQKHVEMDSVDLVKLQQVVQQIVGEVLDIVEIVYAIKGKHRQAVHQTASKQQDNVIQIQHSVQEKHRLSVANKMGLASGTSLHLHVIQIQHSVLEKVNLVAMLNLQNVYGLLEKFVEIMHVLEVRPQPVVQQIVRVVITIVET